MFLEIRECIDIAGVKMLPVISRSTRTDEIYVCLIYSTLWRQVRTLQLTMNMRVQHQNDKSAEEVSRQLLDIGNTTAANRRVKTNIIS